MTKQDKEFILRAMKKAHAFIWIVREVDYATEEQVEEELLLKQAIFKLTKSLKAKR